MSDHATQDNGNESGNRATVALVAEKVESLRHLTEAGFTNIQRQLDAVAGLPVQVAELRARMELFEDREEAISPLPTIVAELKEEVDELKVEQKDMKRQRDSEHERGSLWRWNVLPTIVLFGLSVLVELLIGLHVIGPHIH